MYQVQRRQGMILELPGGNEPSAVAGTRPRAVTCPAAWRPQSPRAKLFSVQRKS
jgi:hypothetical protein